MITKLSRPVKILLASALLLVVPFIGAHTLVTNAPLVYGDVAAADKAKTVVNANRIWTNDALGTNVRQGLNGYKNALLLKISPNGTVYFFLQYLLPLFLIPITYFFFLGAVGIRSLRSRFVCSFFALANPVVFGDILNGQTIWIYIVLPWVFLLTAKLFLRSELTIKNAVLLGVLLTLAMGALPPIAVPLCLMLMLFVLVSLAVRKITIKLLLRTALMGAVVLAVFMFTSLPYFLAASDGQESYAPSASSLIADYKHNYSRTDFLNIYRLAGNEGNGQSTLGYNVVSASNLAGYAIFGLLILGLIARRHDLHPKALEDKNRLYALTAGVVILIVLAMLHLLTVNVDFGVKLFTSQWLLSTIRNPTKIFVLILPLYVLVLGFGIEYLISKTKSRLQSSAYLTGALLLFMIYGWPFLRGDMGLTYAKDAGIQAYKQSDPVVKLAKDNPNSTRSLLINANHDDELNYQDMSSGLNVLRLGGALPKTDDYIQEMNSAYNEQSPYFFNYVSAAGIKRVITKNINNANTPFGLFPNKLEDDQSKPFLSSQLSKQSQDKYFTTYDNDNSLPLIYSPSRVSNVQNDTTVHNIAPLLRSGETVINSKDKVKFAENYSSTSSLSNKSTNQEGYAQAFDPSLVTIEYQVVGDAQKKKLHVNQINGLNGTVEKSFEFSVPNKAKLFMLDGEKYELVTTKQIAYIRIGKADITFYDAEPIAQDVDFEGENIKVADASNSRKGQSNVYGRVVDNESVSGKKSFLLGSSNHLAYFSKSFSLPSEAEYQLKFSYKNISGETPSFNITQSNNYLKFSDGNLDDAKNWTVSNTYVETKDRKPVEINFYTDSKNGQKSENMFDALQISKLQKLNTVTLAIKPSLPDGKITEIGAQNIAKEKESVLKVDFEDGKDWGDIGDATPSDPGTLSGRSYISNDGHDSNKSLAIESSNHLVYVAQRAHSFKPNRVYKLTFWYKSLKGAPLSYALWQTGVNASIPGAPLNKTNAVWQKVEKTFTPDKGTTSIILYLYGSPQDGRTVNLIDDIDLSIQPPISNYLIKTASKVSAAESALVDYKKISETQYSAKLRDVGGLVVLNQSYTNNWRASLIDNKKGTRVDIKNDKHIIVNGFANGWIVDSSDSTERELLLEYVPQERFTKLATISLGFSIICVVYLALVYTLGLTHIGNRTERDESL